MGIRDKAINLLERQLTKQAIVLETRPWSNDTFYEVDIHIPQANINWQKGVTHLKCRVGALTFRDYTIAKWDEERNTCTMFIDAAHDGPGSVWVKTLKKDEYISYLNAGTHGYTMNGFSDCLFLGDQSAVGHFLALQQLAGNNVQVSGAVVITDEAHRDELRNYYPGFTVKSLRPNGSPEQAIKSFLTERPVKNNEYICIAGNTDMVVDVRRYLRQCGVDNRLIKAQGFWR